MSREIIDESDVFVDVHKAIRRINPAPKSRVPKGEVVTEPETSAAVGQEDLIDISEETDKAREESSHRGKTPDGSQVDGKVNAKPETSAQQKASGLTRRTSSVAGSSDREIGHKRGGAQDKFKHLGPSNLASRPRQTRYNTVKIKPGGGSLGDASAKPHGTQDTPRTQSVSAAPEGGLGVGVLNSAGKDASDGVLAVQAGYGSMDRSPPRTPAKTSVTSNKGVQADRNGPVGQDTTEEERSRPNDTKRPTPGRSQSHSTIGSLPSRNGSQSPNNKKVVARSGSITENIVEARGIKKVVLEATSSSDDTEESPNGTQQGDAANDQKENHKPNGGDDAGKSGKKKRRRKRKKGGQDSEETPLLGSADA